VIAEFRQILKRLSRKCVVSFEVWEIIMWSMREILSLNND